MLEKSLEQKLVKAAKAAGGLALKFTSPSFAGMPDRILILPDGKASFVEVKQKGRKPSPLQAARHETLRRLGFKAFVLDDISQISGIIRETKGSGAA